MATVRTVDSVFPKRKKANSASAAVDKSRCSLVLKKSKEAVVVENHEELSTSTTGFFRVAAAAAALHRPAAALIASRSAGKDGDSHSNRAAPFFLFFCLMHGCATTSVNVQSVVSFPSSGCGICTAERLCVFGCSCHFLLLWLAAICFLDARSQEISDLRYIEMCSLLSMICDQAGGFKHCWNPEAKHDFYERLASVGL